MLSAIFGENPNTGLDDQYMIDPENHLMPTEDVIRYLEHLGKVFTISGKILLLASGEAIFSANIPANKHVHLVKLAIKTSGGPVDLTLHEDIVISAAGTPVTALNTNRISTEVSGLTINANPTLSSEGTVIDTDYIDATNKVGGVGGESIQGFILKPDSTYAVKLVNNGLQSIEAAYKMVWSEYAGFLFA